MPRPREHGWSNHPAWRGSYACPECGRQTLPNTKCGACIEAKKTPEQLSNEKRNAVKVVHERLGLTTQGEPTQ